MSSNQENLVTPLHQDSEPIDDQTTWSHLDELTNAGKDLDARNSAASRNQQNRFRVNRPAPNMNALSAKVDMFASSGTDSSKRSRRGSKSDDMVEKFSDQAHLESAKLALKEHFDSRRKECGVERRSGIFGPHSNIISKFRAEHMVCLENMLVFFEPNHKCEVRASIPLSTMRVVTATEVRKRSRSFVGRALSAVEENWLSEPDCSKNVFKIKKIVSKFYIFMKHLSKIQKLKNKIISK